MSGAKARVRSKPAALFSSDELASWSRLCRQEVLAVLHKRDSWYYAFDRHVSAPGPDGLPYELARQTHDPPVRSYATKASTSHTLSHASLPASVSSITHGCVAIESSRHQRAMLAHMFGDSLVDGGILQIAERPTPLDPFHFACVSYMAVKTPVAKARKYVLFEHSGSVEDANGELLVFKVVRSMPCDAGKLAQVAPRTADLEFGETYVTYLMRGTDAGRRTDIKSQTMLLLGTSVPSWAVNKLSSSFLDGMVRLATVGASRVLQDRLRSHLPGPIKAKERTPATSTGIAVCHVCQRRKHRLRTLTRVCATCERQVCKACTQQLHVLAADQVSVVRSRFCMRCVDEAQTAGGRVEAASTFSGAPTSSSSSSAGDLELWTRKPRSASVVEYLGM